MAKHSDRIRAIGRYAHPGLQNAASAFMSRFKDDARLKSSVENAWKRVSAVIEAQFKNGAALPIDGILRYFLSEYNNRNFQYGLNSMPSSFNVLEAFFEHRPELACFRLRDERDHLFVMPDFIDFITDPDAECDMKEALQCLDEGVIYSYNVISDVRDFIFPVEGGREYGIAGAAMIRFGSEVCVLLLAGEKTDLAAAREALKKRDEAFKAEAGRAKVKPDEGLVREPVGLLGSGDFWQTLILTRFDFEDATQGVRYLLKDQGNSFDVVTDDVDVFMKTRGDFVSREAEDIFKDCYKRLHTYAGLFEIAKSMLLLPLYFWAKGECVKDERHETELFREINKARWITKKKYLTAKEKIRQRGVAVLASDVGGQPDFKVFDAPDFQVERTGFWKKLAADKIGRDKQGREIHGRTWVQKTLSWIEEDQRSKAVAAKRNDVLSFDNPNAGYIYVMRSPTDKNDVFKVGLTRRLPDERAKEISRGTGVPTSYLVAEDWVVADCVLAEALIHKELSEYRINEKREFFRAPYKVIRDVVRRNVERVNQVQRDGKCDTNT